MSRLPTNSREVTGDVQGELRAVREPAEGSAEGASASARANAGFGCRRLAVTGLVIVLLALSSCGSQEDSSTATNSGAPGAFMSEEYRFSVRYNPRLFHAGLQAVDDAAAFQPGLWWTAWPAELGDTKPDLAALPIVIGIEAAKGKSGAELARDAAMVKADAISVRPRGDYHLVELGGASGYRAEWVSNTGTEGNYRRIVYGLVRKPFSYHLVVNCKASDWQKWRRPVTDLLQSFRVW
jgi:hypothetical protein